MNVVIYARFSSHSQTEQSIEWQLKVCYAYAEANQMNVVGEYIDRAQTGTNDNRPSLQRMLMDSDKHTFEGVIVYQLDRFARNRFDSAINKAKLKKNGVRIISAKENIADDPSGLLVEGVLESMAEYYSAELSQKIRRGMDINAFFQPRKESDRPKAVPDGAVNFAFIGQFAETPRDTIFTTEYSMRTGMESVCTLLDIDRAVPEVWGSKYDVRELLRACCYAIDKKPLSEAPLSFAEKEILKIAVKKVKGTDIELLLKESGLIE